MADILISEVTSGTLDGEGAFDILMKAVDARLKVEYSNGRIVGDTYANVYLGSIQSAMAQAIQFVLQRQQASKISEKSEAEIDLLEQKTLTEQAQILDTVAGNTVAGIVGKQKELYTNQAEGFIRDAEQKGAKVFTDLWTIAKSTDPDAVSLALPLNANQSSMDVMLAKVASGIGVTQEDLGTPSSEATAPRQITGVSQANPAVVTAGSHGLVTGDAVSIANVGGMIELADGNYIVTVLTNDTFQLNNVDSTAYTAYTSGGTVTKL